MKTQSANEAAIAAAIIEGHSHSEATRGMSRETADALAHKLHLVAKRYLAVMRARDERCKTAGISHWLSDKEQRRMRTIEKVAHVYLQMCPFKDAHFSAPEDDKGNRYAVYFYVDHLSAPEPGCPMTETDQGTFYFKSRYEIA